VDGEGSAEKNALNKLGQNESVASGGTGAFSPFLFRMLYGHLDCSYPTYCIHTVSTQPSPTRASSQHPLEGYL